MWSIRCPKYFKKIHGLWVALPDPGSRGSGI